MKKISAVKDRQTVTPAGEKIAKRIKDLIVRPAKTHLDRRGELCEIFNPAWAIHPEPLVYVYQATLQPGAIKGWVKHQLQDDRIFTSMGRQRWVFFDDRKNSPTYKLMNNYTFGERSRVLLIIPKGIYHAVQNVGTTEAMFVNVPTQPYNHADPDKYRLPLKNNLIPFDFHDEMTW